MDVEDPWKWDVDRVVCELCTDHRSWTTNVTGRRMPNPEKLEKALREQEIDGSTLLTEVDEAVLEHRLGITIFGQLATMKQVIRDLRRMSPEYMIWKENYGSEMFLATHVPQTVTPASLVRKRSESPAIFHTPEGSSSKRRKLDSAPEYSTPLRPQEDEFRISNSGTFDMEFSQRVEEVQTFRNNDISEPTMPAADGSLARVPPLSKELRRIAPTLITTEIDSSRDRQIPTAADAVVNNDPQKIKPGEVYIDQDGKKRVIPVLQSGADFDPLRRHQEQLGKLDPGEGRGSEQGGGKDREATERVSETEEKNDAAADAHLCSGYLGKTAHMIDDVFYSGTPLGGDLLPTVDDTEELVQVSHERIPTGRRLYVHGLMKHFLRVESQGLQKSGKQFLAVRPYPAHLVPTHQSPSFTLFSSGLNGDIRATREEVAKWPELRVEAFNQIASPGLCDDENDRGLLFDLPRKLALGGPSTYGDDWDTHLLEKYSYVDGGDIVLPIYGDSDEEDEYDVQTWKEIEEELGTLDRPLLPLKKRKLTNEEICLAIDEGIAQIVVKWTQVKLPKRRLQEWKLWRMSRKDGSKIRRIREAKQHADRINKDRIPKMREEILRELWTSQKQVQKQTKIMEQSIFDREDLAWQISVLKMRVQPERLPLMDAKLQKGMAIKNVTNKEGESLSTDSDPESSSDEMDYFIVSDDEMSTIEGEHVRADIDGGEVTMSEDGMSSLSGIDENAQATTVAKKSQISVENEISSSPCLAIRPATNGISPADREMPLLRLGPATMAQDEMPEVVDLTQLTTDTSGGEGHSHQTDITDITTLVKSKTKFRPLFKRETSHDHARSNAIQISDSDDTILRVDTAPHTNQTTIGEPSSLYGQDHQIDRDQLLIAELRRMKPDVKETLHDLFASINQSQMWSEMVEVMHAISEGDTRVRGMNNKTFIGLTGVIRLFEMYAECKRRGPRAKLHSAVVEKLKGREKFFTKFYKICTKTLYQLLHSPMTHPLDDDNEEDSDPLPAIRRKAHVTVSSASEADDVGRNTPHKIRKRKVFENAQARDLREQDRKRLLGNEERRRLLRHRMAQSGSHVKVDRGRIIINDAKDDNQGFIYVHDQIAKDIKDHQIEGVRFMWSQVVTDENEMQGCLLAHTMGLGKTMQVITLLVAIAEAAQSPDESISSQIPESLRTSKTLVLCPPGLIDNWMDELLIWAPPGVLGDYRKVDSALRGVDLRIAEIDSWYKNGGILILGYEMFRHLIQNKPTKKTAAPLDKEEHKRIERQLLQGPNIIVADEAHKLKNSTSSLNQASVRFRSNSRIALTGSPLANNVEEYHTMIDWVAPNYLGPIVEFRAKYVEPIQQGLWYDSSLDERRESLKKLGVLKEDLSPKVHRADISVLRHDLKPKTEFVITVPLTELQRKAYSLYVRSMQGKSNELTKDGQLQQTTLWHWLSILSLLCNHPKCFQAKLSESNEDAQKKIVAAASVRRPQNMPNSNSDDDPLTGATPVWKVGVSAELIRQETELFEQFGSSIDSIDNSYKVKLLLLILDASKAVGDKVLIFTQSRPTLDYLEGLCKRDQRAYARLDGDTKMGKRQGYTKAFNNGATELYLISTQAGGLGLNLPGANRVIIFDFKFNPINEEQAVGRAYRIGQKKPVFVYRFVAGGTFEEIVHNKAVFKMQLASRVVDKKNPVAWAKRKTGDFLFEPKPVLQQDLSSFEGMDPKVLDVLLDTQPVESSIRAIVMTDTFERHDNYVLTPEDLKEVEQLVNDEKLKRSDPKAWSALEVKRLQDIRHRAQAAGGARMDVPVHQKAPIPGGLSANPQANQFLEGDARFSVTASHREFEKGGKPRRPSVGSFASAFSLSGMGPVAGVNTKVRDYVAYSYGMTGEPHNTSSPKGINSMKSRNGHGPLPTPNSDPGITSDTANQMDRFLRVALKQALTKYNTGVSSEVTLSSGTIETAATSIRKEIEGIDAAALTAGTHKTIQYLIQDTELSISFLTGKLTPAELIGRTLKEVFEEANVTETARTSHPRESETSLPLDSSADTRPSEGNSNSANENLLHSPTSPQTPFKLSPATLVTKSSSEAPQSPQAKADKQYLERLVARRRSREYGITKTALENKGSSSKPRLPPWALSEIERARDSNPLSGRAPSVSSWPSE